MDINICSRNQLCLPKESFVALLPFKFSDSWAQFVFEICQDNALLKYCTETVHKISHVQQISILLGVWFWFFFFHNYSSLPTQPHPQELSGYGTKINHMLQVMSPRNLPSREMEGKGRKQNKIYFLSVLWIINEPGFKIKHRADELDLKKTTLLIDQMHQKGLFLNKPDFESCGERQNRDLKPVLKLLAWIGNTRCKKELSLTSRKKKEIN